MNTTRRASAILLVLLVVAALAPAGLATKRWGEPPAAAAPVGEGRAPVPTAYAPPVDKAPTIDGKLDEAAWQAAPPCPLGSTLDGSGRAPVATEVRCLQDGKTLYVAFRAAEPTGKVKASRLPHDGAVWGEDSFEMFLGAGATYYHIGVNAAGSTYDGRVKDGAFNSGLKAAAAIGEKEWTAELAIPLDKLVEAKLPERWTVNFHRNRYASGSQEEFAWSPTGSGDSHVPDRFGTLMFAAPPKDAPTSAKDAAVTFAEAEGAVGIVRVNLSELPKDAKIVRAELLVFRAAPVTGADDAAGVDIVVFPMVADKPAEKPLELKAPWFDRFDATEAVRACLANPRLPAGAIQQPPAGAGGSVAFLLKSGVVNLRATCLDVAWEGAPEKVPAQVSDVKAVHRAGQTFITFKEIEDPAGTDEIKWGALRSVLAGLDKKQRVRYVVYRSDKPITADTLAAAEPIAEVAPLSGWNINGRNVDKPIDHALGTQDVLNWHQWNPFRSAAVEGEYGVDCLMERLVIADGGEPLPRQTGVYVHTPGKAGDACYAVVTSIDGVQNTKDISAANAAGPVKEVEGIGEPVLQKEFSPKPYFNYKEKRFHYVQWVAPPMCSLPSAYYNWSVGVPEASPLSRDPKGSAPGAGDPQEDDSLSRDPKGSAPGAGDPQGDDSLSRDAKRSALLPVELSLHRDGRSYYRTQYRIDLDSLILAPHDFPVCTWWYGHHEALGTLKSFKQGVVQPYTERRLLAFIDWAGKKWPIDRNRITVTGPGGGAAGGGSIHLGVRYPDVFNLVVSGYGAADYAGEIDFLAAVKRAGAMPQRLESILGRREWACKTDKGLNVWDELNCTRAVRALPAGTHLPLITVTGQGMTKATRDFLAAMVETNQPVMARFGVYGGGLVLPVTRTGNWSRMILQDLALDQPMPVFLFGDTASLYVDPKQPSGNLVVSDGINWWWGDFGTGFRWKTGDIVDQPNRVEITVYSPPGGRDKKPHADVTLRRVRNFKPRPGYEYTYELLSAAGDKIESGKVTPAAGNVMTFKGVPIPAEGTRIVVRP